jgi:hypothetical protein
MVVLHLPHLLMCSPDVHPPTAAETLQPTPKTTNGLPQEAAHSLRQRAESVPYVEFQHCGLYDPEIVAITGIPLALDRALIRPGQLTHWHLSMFLGSEPLESPRSLT